MNKAQVPPAPAIVDPFWRTAPNLYEVDLRRTQQSAEWPLTWRCSRQANPSNIRVAARQRPEIRKSRTMVEKETIISQRVAVESNRTIHIRHSDRHSGNSAYGMGGPRKLCSGFCNLENVAVRILDEEVCNSRWIRCYFSRQDRARAAHEIESSLHIDRLQLRSEYPTVTEFDPRA